MKQDIAAVVTAAVLVAGCIGSDASPTSPQAQPDGGGSTPSGDGGGPSDADGEAVWDVTKWDEGQWR